MTLATVPDHGAFAIDQTKILASLGLDPRKSETHALMLVCERYNLDPVLKHMVLIKDKPYITRDGYLHVAHQSGQLDGIEVVEDGENDKEWWAKVAVYRKDMARPFTYKGRYPKRDAGHMAKYGPEMAIKVGEVMALRRAFSVTGVGASDEQWDAVDVTEATEPTPDMLIASQDAHADISERITGLDDEQKATLGGWWKGEGFPGLQHHILTVGQVDQINARIDELTDSTPDGSGVTDALAGDPEHAGDGGGGEGSRPSDPPPPDPITAPQLKALNTALHTNGHAGPARLAKLTEMLGRDITSTKDLTKAEATWAIDQLGFDKVDQAELIPDDAA